MSASKPGDEEEEDREEAVLGKKLTRDPGRSIPVIQAVSALFQDMGPSMMQARKLKRALEGGLGPHRKFREMKEQSQTAITCISVKSPRVCLPLLPPLPPPQLLPLPPLRLQDQLLPLSLLNLRRTRTKAFLRIRVHLIRSK